MERFGIDSYLYNLSKDIKNNEYINSCNFYNQFNLKASDLRNELKIFNSLNLNLEDVFVKYRGKTCLTSPKNIKIILGKECNGTDISHLYRSTIYYGNCPDLFDVIHRYIFINTVINYSAKSSYLHEITHTQQVVGKNIINPDNEEILPMFIEFLYGYIYNTDQLLYKLKRVSSYIDGYMKAIDDKTRDEIRRYLTSTLKAIKLYHLYMENSNNKKEIINDLSNVFKYNSILEEVLSKYDITFDSSKEDIKTLIKK